MTVTTTWVSPTGATIDLSNGTVVSETNWDALASDLYRLGGTDGNAKTGPLVIGSSTSFSHSFMTVGLLLDQTTNDDEILAMKSDVAHGMTTLTDTNVYATFKKQDANTGGLHVRGLGGTAATGALVLIGSLPVAVDNSKSTGSTGCVRVIASTKSGTTSAAIAANSNMVTFENQGTTRFILDSDGDSHQDVGTSWTTFDRYDDAALLNALAAEVARPDDPIKEEFRGWLSYNRAALEEARLVAFDAGGGHHFVNMSRLTMLLVGAVRQQGLRLREMERRLLPAG
jgi:hypothetical protein